MTATLPRLLAGVGVRPMADLSAHLDVHGALDLRRHAPAQLIDLVDASGLLGHGGAAFPAAVKMRAVAARRKLKFVVANGTEGEPASKKDRALLRETPHLVLDGAALAARAVAAREAIVAVCERDERGLASVHRALEQRRDLPDQARFRVVETPERFLSGQESALVDFLNGGPGRPTFGPRPFERGVADRPTLVQNVETLAHMALIGRHGTRWFRALGTEREPGSALVTVSGAVAAPGVYEIDHGMPLADLLGPAGAGVEEPLGAVLIGGYFGTWVPAAAIPDVRLSGEQLRRHSASLGAGVIVGLPRSACPVAETARVADYLAAESAGQCGPCVNGLAAVAETVQLIAAGTASAADQRNLSRWLGDLPGRGACRHPDGAAHFIASAVRAFAADFDDHARNGPCERCDHPPLLASCAYA